MLKLPGQAPASLNQDAGVEAFALSCPGNLLLAGEYAVLDEGGLGICLAPDPRAWLAAFPPSKGSSGGTDSQRKPFRVFAVQTPMEEARLIHQVHPSIASDRSGRSPTIGSPEMPDLSSRETSVSDPLFEAVLSVLGSRFSTPAGRAGSDSMPAGIADNGAMPSRVSQASPADQDPTGPWNLPFGWDFLLDTSAFHNRGGRKLGLGSSAAACLLLTAALMPPALRASRLTSPDSLAIPRLAVEAHRLFQGGKGSGYDVWTSWTGGISVFCGGKVPHSEPLAGLEDGVPGFRLLKGEKPQKTVSAIRLWNDWRSREPEGADAYVSACRSRAEAARMARTWKDLENLLAGAKADGIALGQAIGCPADFPCPQADADEQVSPSCPGPGLVKATGAGNENAIAFPPFLTGKGGLGEAMQCRPGPGLMVHPALHASGRAKLTLFGEHTALDGWPACGLGLEEELRLMAIPLAEVEDSRELPGQDSHLAADLKDSLHRLASSGALDLADQPARLLFALSDVPRSGGFGSSAALSLALTRLSCRLRGSTETEDELWTLANTLDSVFHGRASGMDTGLGLTPGFRVLEPRVPAPAVPGGAQADLMTATLVPPRFRLGSQRQGPEIWIVHGGLRRTGNTRDLVAAMRKSLVMEGPEGDLARKTYASLAAISVQACALLGDQENSSTDQGTGSCGTGPGPGSLGTDPDAADRIVTALARLTTGAQDCLDCLGLVSGECRQVLAGAMDHGSLAGKMSGAGGGGAFWCLCADGTSAKQLAAWLNSADGLPPLASQARIALI